MGHPDAPLPPKSFVRFRYPAVGAYYTTQLGIAEIGYSGNEPVIGPYPGPDKEAEAHIDEVIRRLEGRHPEV